MSSQIDKSGNKVDCGDVVQVLCKVIATVRGPMPGEKIAHNITVEVIGEDGLGEATQLSLHSGQVEVVK